METVDLDTLPLTLGGVLTITQEDGKIRLQSEFPVQIDSLVTEIASKLELESGIELYAEGSDVILAKDGDVRATFRSDGLAVSSLETTLVKGRELTLDLAGMKTLLTTGERLGISRGISVPDLATSRIVPSGELSVEGSLKAAGIRIGDTPSEAPLSIRSSGGKSISLTDGVHTAHLKYSAGALTTVSDLILLDADEIRPSDTLRTSLGSPFYRFLSVWAAELQVQTLVAQDTLATIGGRVIVSPTSKLTHAISETDTVIEVEHAQFFPGDVLWLEGGGSFEMVRVEQADETRLVVQRNYDGSGPNSWDEGTAVVNTGRAGHGYLDLYSRTSVAGTLTASEAFGPTIAAYVRTGSAASDLDVRTALGNLRGLYDYTRDVYGFAAGDHKGVWISVDADRGLRITRDDVVVGQWDTEGTITVGDTSAAHVRIEAGSIRIKNAGRDAILLAEDGSGFLANENITFDSDGYLVVKSGAEIGGWKVHPGYLEAGSGADRLKLVAGGGQARVMAGEGLFSDPSTPFYLDEKGRLSLGNQLIWDGETLTITGAIDLTGTVSWDDIQNKPGYLGTPTGSGLYLSSTHLGFYDGSAWQAYMDNQGNFFLGDLSTGPGLSWASNTLTIKGTVLIQDAGIWKSVQDYVAEEVTGGGGTSPSQLRVSGVSGTFTPLSANEVRWENVTVHRFGYPDISVGTGQKTLTSRMYMYVNVQDSTVNVISDPSNRNSSEVLIAVFEPGQNKANIQVVGGGIYMSGDWINAGSITAAELATDYLEVGSVIESSSWSAGTGIQFDMSAGTFEIRSGGNTVFSWDGTNLSVKGSIELTAGSTGWANLDVPDRFRDQANNVGLYLTPSYLGYYDGSEWKSYIDSFGNFRFGGTNKYVAWDGSELTVVGNVVATSGEIQGDLNLGGKLDSTRTSLQLGVDAVNRDSIFYDGIQLDAENYWGVGSNTVVFRLGGTHDYVEWDGNTLSMHGVIHADYFSTNRLVIDASNKNTYFRNHTWGGVNYSVLDLSQTGPDARPAQLVRINVAPDYPISHVIIPGYGRVIIEAGTTIYFAYDVGSDDSSIEPRYRIFSDPEDWARDLFRGTYYINGGNYSDHVYEAVAGVRLELVMSNELKFQGANRYDVFRVERNLVVGGRIQVGEPDSGSNQMYTQAAAGQIRFVNGRFEGYDGNGWKKLDLGTNSTDEISGTIDWSNINGIPEFASRWPNWAEVGGHPSLQLSGDVTAPAVFLSQTGTITLNTQLQPKFYPGLDADLWDGRQFADYLDQPVRTTDSVTFAGVSTPLVTLTGSTPKIDFGASFQILRDAGGLKFYDGSNALVWNNTFEFSRTVTIKTPGAYGLILDHSGNTPDQPAALLIRTDADGTDDIAIEVRGEADGTQIHDPVWGAGAVSTSSRFVVFGDGTTVIGRNAGDQYVRRALLDVGGDVFAEDHIKIEQSTGLEGSESILSLIHAGSTYDLALERAPNNEYILHLRKSGGAEVLTYEESVGRLILRDRLTVQDTFSEFTNQLRITGFSGVGLKVGKSSADWSDANLARSIEIEGALRFPRADGGYWTFAPVSNSLQLLTIDGDTSTSVSNSYLHITDTGVGINAQPSYLFDVGGTARVSKLRIQVTGSYQSILEEDTQLVVSNSFAVDQITAGLTRKFEVTGSSTYIADKLGVGTQSPAHKLHLTGTGSVGIRIDADTDNNNSAQNAYLTLSQDGGATRGTLSLTAGDNLKLDAETGGNLQLAVGGVVRAVIDSSGRLGVGTTLPTHKAHIVGTSLVTDTATFGGDLLPQVSYSGNIGSPLQKWLSLHVAEAYFETLVADERRVTMGGRLIVGHATTLYEDVSPSDTQIKVKHNNILPGDILHLEKFDGTSSQVEFMRAESSGTGYNIGTEDEHYVYTVTRNLDGTGANSWKAGDAVANTGQVGYGFIDLYAKNSLLESHLDESNRTLFGPTIAFHERTGTGFNDIATVAAIGRLDGIVTDAFGTFENQTLGVYVRRGFFEKDVIVGGYGLSINSFAQPPLELFAFDLGTHGALQGTVPVGLDEAATTSYGLISGPDLVATLRQEGPFGKMLRVERATTNLALDPLYKTGVIVGNDPTKHSINVISGSTGSGSVNGDVLRVTGQSATLSDVRYYSKEITIDKTKSLVISFECRNNAALNHCRPFLRGSAVDDYTNSERSISNFLQSSEVLADGFERRVYVLDPNTLTGSGNKIRFCLFGDWSGSGPVDFEIRYLQIEQDVAEATSFTETSRPAGLWKIPAEVIPRDTGSLAFWFTGSSTGDYYLFSSDVETGIGAFSLKTGAQTTLTVAGSSTTVAFSPSGLHYVTLTWESGAFELYIDGELMATLAAAMDEASLRGSFALHSAGTQSSVAFDDLVIFQHALSQTEIQKIVNSGSSISPDSPRTYITGSQITTGVLASQNNVSLINLNDGTFSFAGGQLIYDGTVMQIGSKLRLGKNLTGYPENEYSLSIGDWTGGGDTPIVRARGSGNERVELKAWNDHYGIEAFDATNTRIFRLGREGTAGSHISSWKFDAQRFYDESNQIELRPSRIRVAQSNVDTATNSYVELYYNSSASWGLRGLDSNGSTVFQLGSTNEIFDWKITPNKLQKSDGSSYYIEAGSLFGLSVEGFGVRRVNDNAEIYLGWDGANDTYVFHAGLRSNPAFLITRDTKKIAGWYFDTTRIWSGSGNSVTGLTSLGGSAYAFFAGAIDSAGTDAKAVIRADGSGYLAGGNVLWDAGGNVNLTGVITALAGGNVGGWSIGSSELTGGNLKLKASGEIENTLQINGQPAYILKSDGSGHLAGGKVAWDTLGNVTVIGTIDTESGTIGGWTIGSTFLGSTNIRIHSGNVGTARMEIGPTDGTTGLAGLISAAAETETVIWAGSGTASRSDAPFRVTLGGDLYAEKGTIGGWLITSDTIQSSFFSMKSGLNPYLEISYNGLGAGISAPNGNSVVFWAGESYDTRGIAPFRVTVDGSVYAENITLKNPIVEGSTTAGSIIIGSETGRVAGDGLELYGSSSSAFLSVEDGNGRIQLKWNATRGTSESFLVANEPAGRWEFDPASPGDSLFSVDYAPAVLTGGAISWNNILKVGNTSFTYQGNKIWHAGNDGSGSGLDADLLDGIEGSAFAQKALNETITGIWTFTKDPTIEETSTAQYTSAQLRLRHDAPGDNMRDIRFLLQNSVAGGGGASKFFVRHHRDVAGTWRNFIQYDLSSENLTLDGAEVKATGENALRLDAGGAGSVRITRADSDRVVVENDTTVYLPGTSNSLRIGKLGQTSGGLYLTASGYADNPSWGAVQAGAWSDMGTYRSVASAASGVFFKDGRIEFRAVDGLPGDGSAFTFPERMRIMPDGKVGIGTSSPAYSLHVVGDTQVEGTLRAKNFGDGKELLKLEAERAWSFWQKGAGAASELHLRPEVNAKTFDITTQDAITSILRIYAENTGDSRVEMLKGGAGHASIGGAYDAARLLRVYGTTRIDGDTDIYAILYVQDDVTVGGGISVTDHATVGGDLNVGGNGVISGYLGVGMSANPAYSIDTMGSVHVGNALTVEGTTTLNEDFFVAGTSDLTGPLYVRSIASFFDDLSSDTYASGWAGSGWRLWHNYNGTSQNLLEVDNLTVRGRLSVYELLIQQLRATNGNVVVSDARRVVCVSVDTVGQTATFEAVDEEPVPFAANDLLLAQRFTGQGTYQVRLTVTNIAATPPYGFTASYAGSIDAPVAGQEYDFARVGNTSDATRDALIYLASTDTGAPFIDVIDGVQSWGDWGDFDKTVVRLGKLEGVTDPDLGALSGYGLYSDNAYLRGTVVATSGSIGDQTGWRWVIDPQRLRLTDGTHSPIIMGLSRAGGVTDPEIRISKDGESWGTSNYVRMYWDGSTPGSETYGIEGVSGGLQVFHLGDVNQIAGWQFDDARLYSGNIEMLSSGAIQHTGGKWGLSDDGSGSLAGGAISWDAAGTLTIGNGVVKEVGVAQRYTGTWGASTDPGNSSGKWIKLFSGQLSGNYKGLTFSASFGTRNANGDYAPGKLVVRLGTDGSGAFYTGAANARPQIYLIDEYDTTLRAFTDIRVVHTGSNNIEVWGQIGYNWFQNVPVEADVWTNSNNPNYNVTLTATAEQASAPAGVDVWDLASNGRENKILRDAKGYADTLSQEDKDAFAQNLGYIDYANLVAAAAAGNTIISGGFIRTSLIDAETVLTNALLARKITTSDVDFTVVGTGNVVATINASTEGLRISAGLLQIDATTVWVGDHIPSHIKADYDAEVAALRSDADAILGGFLTSGTTIIQGGFIKTNLIDTDALTIKWDNLTNVPSLLSTTPSAAGLYATASGIGYWNGSLWTSYIAGDGSGQLAGGAISWTAGGALTISGYATETYADGAASTAETNAKGYADGVALTAETNAKGYTDGKLDTTAQKFGFSDFASLSSAQALGSTLISGGYLNTAVIQANSIGTDLLVSEWGNRNVFPNGSFEYGNALADMPMSGFGAVDVTIADGDGRDGGRALRVEKTSTSPTHGGVQSSTYARPKADLGVVDGVPYVASAWVYNEHASDITIRLKLQWRDGGDLVTESTRDVTVPPGEWRFVWVTHTHNSGQGATDNVYVQVNFANFSGTSVGAAYRVDQVALHQGAQPLPWSPSAHDVAIMMGYTHNRDVIDAITNGRTIIAGGYLNANVIQANSITADKIATGTLDASVYVQAGDVANNKVAGLAGGSTAGDVGLWAGAKYDDRATAPFRVAFDGSLYSTKGSIAGWDITTDSIKKQLQSGGYDTYYFEMKVPVGGSTQRVLSYGNVDESVEYFYLDGYGKLFASNADISGKITATSGSFTGTLNVGSRLQILGTSAGEGGIKLWDANNRELFIQNDAVELGSWTNKTSEWNGGNPMSLSKTKVYGTFTQIYEVTNVASYHKKIIRVTGFVTAGATTGHFSSASITFKIYDGLTVLYEETILRSAEQLALGTVYITAYVPDNATKLEIKLGVSISGDGNAHVEDTATARADFVHTVDSTTAVSPQGVVYTSDNGKRIVLNRNDGSIEGSSVSVSRGIDAARWDIKVNPVDNALEFYFDGVLKKTLKTDGTFV
ncbi:MAG: hypothetical protein D6800_04400 [Candidatus Zixiibacteriota bacterium]|nr:MAG: hypothetical protein D6800_04400 [candidate division Zixibacteria bacterium]